MSTPEQKRFPARSEVVFMDNPHDGPAKYYAVADEPNWRVWRLGECGKENIVCTVADLRAGQAGEQILIERDAEGHIILPHCNQDF